MQQIDWNKFGLKGEDKSKSFEDLCMFLCCRELKISKIDSYQNQPGIETEPFEVNSKKYGFQVKFFKNGFNWKQIEHSIVGEKDKDTKSKNKDIQYPSNIFKKYKINKIFIYSSKDKTLNRRNKTSSEKLIKDLAKKHKAEIEFITDKDILLKLSQPSNLDLAQLYFGIGDELGFVRNSVNSKILTFIQSSEYLNLPFIDDERKQINVSEKILRNNYNIFLLTGNPGAGKSIFMHKLLEIFGGLNKAGDPKTTGKKIEPNLSKMIAVLTKNNAVPVLINLKNCISDSLENIIRGRKNDCKVNGQDLSFIYLFDGFDELNENKADNVLLYINELSRKSDTKKIIISCRSGSNNIRKKDFNDICKYQIADLEEKYVDIFFKAKTTKSKIEKLSKLKKNNTSLIREIRDILFIKLFWDTIEKLSESSTILDLFSKKIDLLLNSPEHRKDIENLNLLNCKKQAILNLNQDISFELQKKFQFRFSQKNLQELVLNKFPRLDYKSINTILNYVADLFFENSYSDSFNSETTYIYQHRRYQEYFFTQRLKSEYEKNPQIIRELKVLSNREYFEKMFLKYVRKEYEKNNNLPGAIELNLIDVYLGKHKGFGVDDDYYMNSSEFIPALTCQEAGIFNELFEDENLRIRDKISIDFNEIEKQFKKWKKDKNNYSSVNYLKSIWKNGISSLIENIVLFWKANKKDIANEFRMQLQKIMDLYKNSKFLENLKKDERQHLGDPFYNQFENWVYYRLVIKNEGAKDVFDNSIRENHNKYKVPVKNSYSSFDEDPKSKFVKSFFHVCLKEKKEELFELINDFDEYEFTAFLDVLKTIDYLPVFIQSKLIHKKIKSFVKEYSQKLNEKNIFILFYKKFFNLKISTEEREFAKIEFSKLREKRSNDWHMYKTHIDFSLISYVLDEFSFEKFLKKQEGYQSRYYDECGLYSALFKNFVDLLKEKKKIEATVRDYICYINFYIEETDRHYLKVDISFLWANIIANSELDKQSLLQVKNVLIKEKNNIVPFNFYLQLNRLSPSISNHIINESELGQYEDDLLAWSSDFPSYVDRCFELSILFSSINSEKAKFYFKKGVIEGILRHGWRKDIIVSYLLVDALEILWKNNWETVKKLKQYSKEVFKLTLRVSEITDGKETWQGPYNVIKLIAKYNIALAEEYKKILIKKEGYYNFSNSVITSILTNKVKLGLPIEKIEKGMEEYRQDYGYEGKPRSDYYEQMFIVYLEIAECDFYTNEEKKTAFDKAYNQIEEIIKQKIDYYLRDIDFKNEKQRFEKMCKKYNQKFNLKFDEKNNNEHSFLRKKNNISEKQFIKEIQTCKTSKQITEKYKKLDDYNNEIVLSNYESWKILIDKTFEINNNIETFLNYLKKDSFPHTDFYTSNSKYYHLALAVALKNINTRQETLKYLFKNSGHGGFVNTMKAYEVIEDKNMCLALFNRYLKFCRLIVN